MMAESEYDPEKTLQANLLGTLLGVALVWVVMFASVTVSIANAEPVNLGILLFVLLGSGPVIIWVIPSIWKLAREL